MTGYAPIPPDPSPFWTIFWLGVIVAGMIVMSFMAI